MKLHSSMQLQVLLLHTQLQKHAVKDQLNHVRVIGVTTTNHHKPVNLIQFLMSDNSNGAAAQTTSFLATNSPGNLSTLANEDVHCVRK